MLLLSILSITGLVASATAASTQPAAAPCPDTGMPFNITALNGVDGESVLECWQLENQFRLTSRSGIAGSQSLFMGDLTNGTYNIIPARYDGDFNNAPAFQYVLVISGLAHITLHRGSDEYWQREGRYGLIIAGDTADVSKHAHRTQFPGSTDTLSMGLPIPNRKDFWYTLLHSGPCTQEEMVGL